MAEIINTVVDASNRDGETMAEAMMSPEESSYSTFRRGCTLTRISKRKTKYKDTVNDGKSGGGGTGFVERTKKPSFFNSNSLNRLLSKVVHKMTINFNLQSKNMYSSPFDGVDPRADNNILSLSSTDICDSKAIRVPPIKTTSFVRSDKVPGVIGLRNHGNTCFINAVLQCLSHTDILAEYFVLDQYKVDLSRRNKLNSKKYGTKGEVTEQLAILLKSIWSCQYSPDLSNQFKTVVDKYGSQYRGNNQHDAQEFLLWLLDKVHEDLNTATKKKYKAIKNSFGKPEVVAAETLANHVRCNNSFVHAVFQAQFCSSVTCRRCNKQSNTFDPFLCVSVPVPQNHQGIYVTVLYSSQQPRQVKLGLMLPINDEVKDLRKTLSSYTGISDRGMLITEITDDGFQRTFLDSTLLGEIKDTDSIYCLELPQSTDSDSEGYLLLCWVNLLVVENRRTRFGSPFTMPICRETSYVDLQKLLLKEMAWMLHDDVLTTDQEIPLFRIRVSDTADSPELSYLDPTVDHPLYTEPVEHAFALQQITNSGPQHLKLILEWDLQAKESTICDDSDQVEEHSSVKQLKLTAEQGITVTLAECFKLYTKAEVLGAEDAWHCPNCNLKEEVIKQLGLWTLPDILVVHMKRFKQGSDKHQSQTRMPVKLTTLVDFPIIGFDMTPHLADPAYRSTSPPSLWSPWRRPSAYKQSLKRESNAYDLYAICNHHGQDLLSGHYTACCRNPYDGQWYCFDDAKVTQVAESALITPAAYILFYQRRAQVSSSSSSSTGSGTEHWASRLSVVKHARSSEEITIDGKRIKNELCMRGERAYATLQPVNKRQVATDVNKSDLSNDVYLSCLQPINGQCDDKT